MNATYRLFLQKRHFLPLYSLLWSSSSYIYSRRSTLRAFVSLLLLLYFLFLSLSLFSFFFNKIKKENLENKFMLADPTLPYLTLPCLVF